MSRRTGSFVWGGLVALIILGLGLYSCVSNNDYTNLATCIVLTVLSFTLVSCLILNNNFVGEMMADIFSWGFVRMPGVIFTLDLDGLIWLLTVKLLFWILGFVLAIICGIFAIILGLAISVFVYPFAIYKSFKHGDADVDSL